MEGEKDRGAGEKSGMKAETEIVGILLVKNEDVFLERVLRNISAFCDHLIIADHESTDGTGEIVKNFCAGNRRCWSYTIKNPGQSHELIRDYAGKKVWIFGVDGDELYDPQGLRVLRGQLKSGRYDDFWMILGNVLHCVHLDPEKNTARGYMAPPCRSMTKLYNFNAILRWNGKCPERLHGGRVVFKPGYDQEKRYYLYKHITWEDSVFRSLHLCFLPRSSTEKPARNRMVMRRNIADNLSENLLQRLKHSLSRRLGYQGVSDLKREKYMRGHMREVDTRSFRIS